jgi:3-(3-hydroxy-phenyl)propionate hydroxylase
MTDQQRVIVVGAGPVGVVAALSAALRGFPVTLLESEVDIDNSPRAATFHPSTLDMIDGLGIMEEFLAVGLAARYFDFWDKPSRTLVARMDHDVLRDDTRFPFVVQTEQHKLVRMCLARLERMPDVEVRLGWSVESVAQDEKSVTVKARSADGTDQVEGRWLIACDGGRSTIRKALGIEFEGYTWPERFVVLTTLYDFAGAMGCSPRSYFADPDEWANLFKVAGDDLQGRWRVVFPTGVDESDEQAMSDASSEARLARIWPAQEPRELVHRKLYKVHQRVAAKFRDGRIFLAGDAAHVNNPIGGLGLNCGIHDVMELLDTLESVVTGGAEEALLDRYERRRRTLNIEFVQQQTVDNKRRLEEKDPQKRRARLDELASIAADEERQRAFLRRTSLLDSVRRSNSID